MCKTKVILSYKPLFDKKIMMIKKYTIYNIDKNINKIYSKRTNKKNVYNYVIIFFAIDRVTRPFVYRNYKRNKNL